MRAIALAIWLGALAIEDAIREKKDFESMELTSRLITFIAFLGCLIAGV